MAKKQKRQPRKNGEAISESVPQLAYYRHGSAIELTDEPGRLSLLLQFHLHVNIIQGDTHVTGDQYKTEKSNVAAMGPHAKAETFTQNYQSPTLEQADITQFTTELTQLRQKLDEAASSDELVVALGSVTAAQIEAKKGPDADKSKILSALRGGGSWLLEFAQKVGVTIVAEILKEALGIKK